GHELLFVQGPLLGGPGPPLRVELEERVPHQLPSGHRPPFPSPDALCASRWYARHRPIAGDYRLFQRVRPLTTTPRSAQDAGMSELAQRRCEPCEGGMPPIPPERVAELQGEIDTAWQVEEGR